MKILVTGGAGMMGSHLVDRLVSEGHEVVVVDSFERQVHPSFPTYLNEKADYFFSRLENCQFLDEILQGVETVFHFASKVGVAQSSFEIYDFYRANVTSTAFLLQKCVDSSVKRIVLAGSMAPYGEGPYVCSFHGTVYPKARTGFECECPLCNRYTSNNLPINEQEPFNPLSNYAVTKQTQESMVQLFGKTCGVETVVLRFFSVYGSRQTVGNPYAGPIPIFISKVLKKESPVVFEDGLQTRDFIHVKDAVNACVLAMRNGVGQSSFNIGTGKKTLILELADTICCLLGSSVKPIVTGEFRFGDIRHSLADASKAKHELGFSSTVSLQEGLRETLSWVKHE
jgi:dTDP-L-rhamnose 4-epimerase